MSTSRKSSRFFGGWRGGDAQPNSHAGPVSSAADELAQLSLGATATVSISANRTSSGGGGSKQPHSRAQPSEDGSVRGGKEGASLRACRGLSIPSPATVLLGDDRPASTSSGSPPSSPPATPAPDSPVLGRSLGGGGGGGGSSTSNVGSCRRLWESIRGGGRERSHGSGRAGGGGANSVREVTVDSLVKAVMRARTGQPAIEAVREGLYCLDGRAVAALLKELAKNGLQYAASELFDWLRALPPSHQLSRLVDVYTYTTIISQCGNHQQLRKALELVAEMRSKGIPCNIHTFSALMSVCVKCNECELALDVYEQLQAEGCTPNMVTFNILIDIHSKGGSWESAMAVLDQIRGQGLTLEARTYNTVISACSKTGQPHQALKVYERMLADGVAPTGTTYTSLISAYGKAGQVEEALRVYEDMMSRGCECNVITYSSLISACERAGRWEVALQLFDRMLREECRPNVVTYNGLIGACGQGGALEKATEVFDHMISHGCRPDAVTFSVLIAAYEKGGQWGKALQTLERMQQAGFRPDACVYNCVLDGLWSTGVAAAQSKAVQLFQYACRQGHLRLHANSSREFTAVAHTYCAALLFLLKWLGDCRDLLPTLSRTSGPLPTLSLHLIKGKHCRSDQSYQPIQASLQQMARAFSIPVAIMPNEQGLVVQVESLNLAAWLASDNSSVLLQPLCHPLCMPMPSSTLLQADAISEQQCCKAFGAVKEFEATHALGMACARSSPNRAGLWQAMTNVIVSLAGSLGVCEETTHDALQLCDRLLASGAAVEEGEATMMAAALLLLTCKQGGQQPLSPPAHALLLELLGLPEHAVMAAEKRIFAAFHGDASAVSALRVLQLYLERLGCSSEVLVGSWVKQLTVLSSINLVSKAALTPVFYQFQPSAVAAACLYKTREGLGLSPPWPTALRTMTGFSPHNQGEAAKECLELISVLGLAS